MRTPSESIDPSLKMSNSDELESEQNGIESVVSTAESPDLELSSNHRGERESKSGGTETASVSSEPISLGGLSAVEEDEDGFRTPTGPEHRIPVPTECPPAPKRDRCEFHWPRKRKKTASSGALRRFEKVEVDPWTELLESAFPRSPTPAPPWYCADNGPEIKRARTDHNL